MNRRALLLWIIAGSVAACSVTTQTTVSKDVLIQLVEAEDTRNWNAVAMTRLLADSNPAVRSRTALAAGRIGDDAALAQLVDLLKQDKSMDVAATAAFAIGEIESAAGIQALLQSLNTSSSNSTRAAAVEALGKIAAALPEKATNDKKQIGKGILDVLHQQLSASRPDRQVTLLALTAVLRAKPDGGPAVVVMFLDSTDARIRADALNTLARLRAKESLDIVRKIVSKDSDPIVRANAARVLGAAGDAPSVDALATTMAKDLDSRVRVACIRALASIAHERSAPPLLERADTLLALNPTPAGELLEIATALGRVLPNSNNERAATLLARFREAGIRGPEVEGAYARFAPQRFLEDSITKSASTDWQQLSATASGLTEIAALKDKPDLKAKALAITQELIRSEKTPDKAMADLLRALQAFKPADLLGVLRTKLRARDIVVRAAAADILSELPPSKESTGALLEALQIAMQETQNDAAISIVAALATVQDPAVTMALLEAAKSSDYLVRRRAIESLKGRPEASSLRAGPVKSRNTRVDYTRAVERAGKHPRATLTTDKGTITIELHPDEAPLTVDNFIQLAQAHYFDGLTFHRVVPNFVLQGGDPRGDGNGGPGYTIRCEINSLAYDTGTVGMALSGKDTGGSQFFITHSPQPHLDGGYTAFARVVAGQEIVDRIERGDRIHTVTITE
jgi:cyclophilin family peptidyl-prolyl cis-trans isomerase/HEAT repeat protein